MNSIVFQTIDWKEFNEEIVTNPDSDDNNSDSEESLDSSDSVYIIRVFGRTLDDKSVYAKIINYTPHFYVEIPQRFTDQHIERLVEEVKNKNSFYKHHLLSYDTVSRCKFRGFTDDKKFKFVRLIFNNSKAMQAFARTLNGKISIPGMSKMVKLDVYESNIDSFLRCIHIRDVNTCGWLEIKKYKKNSEASSCDINIICDWKDIHKHENQNLGGAPFKICSFDIECTSGDGSFPQASRIEDKIIQIGSVFGRYGGDVYKKHIITLGSCDPIDGVEVISVETEKELLLEWTKLIQEESPDILTGYNIWYFDEKYMIDRAKHPDINCALLFSKLSKISSMNCQFVEKKLSSSALGDNILRYLETHGIVQIDLLKVVQRDYKLSKYSLDAVSENFIQDIINKYTIIDNNTLEIESKNLHFLKVGNYVKLISQVELEYGLKEEVEGEEDEDEGYCNEKYKILSINENKMIIQGKDINFTDEGIKDLGKGLKWGLVKDDVKPNDIFRLQKGTSSDRKIIAEYCIQDCVLVIKLLAKLEILTNSISMANVCHVPLYYLLIRGQGIKSLSLVSKKCRGKQYLIPVLDKNQISDASYEGAIVFDPKIGYYQTYIPVLDYNSLYPSSIIDRNISHETIVIDSQFDNLPDYEYNNVTYKNGDGTTTTCRYARNKNKLGIIPEILQELLTERKITKKLMEKEPDAFKRSILDGKQLALKVTANSLYGQLGASTSPICMKELAASTTAVGREMLETARSFVENNLIPILLMYNDAYIANDNDKIEELNNKYLKDKSPDTQKFIKESVLDFFSKYTAKPEVIYGDTDSIFNNMNIKDKNTGELLTTKEGLIQGIRLGQLSSIFIKINLRHPHNLEYEKTFYPFWIGRKKGYVGNKYEDNPNKFKQSSMGISIKRRDNANIVKKVIGGLINIMMNENDIDKAINYIKSSTQNLLNGNYPITDFITTKTLRATYKGLKIKSDNNGKSGDSGTWFWDDVECGQAHVKLCQRMKSRDPGNAPVINDRIPFVTVYVEKKKGVKLLQGDIIEHPDYIKENNIKIDYLFYLTNQIMNPAVQFLELLTKNPSGLLNEYIKKEELKRAGGISLTKWINVKTNKEPISNENDSDTNNELYDNFNLDNIKATKKVTTNINDGEKSKKTPQKRKKLVNQLAKELYF
jgi:DNA polymerase elongation subunit (family B)